MGLTRGTATDEIYNELRTKDLNERLIIEMNFRSLFPEKELPDA